MGFNDPIAKPYAAQIPPGDFERSWQFLMPDGRRLQGGRAGVELMRRLPGTRRLGDAIRSLHLTWLVGTIYGLISRTRGTLGRFVRNAPGPRRPPVVTSVGEET